MNQPKFIHLNLHSEYSIIDGLVRLKPLCQKLVSDKVQAVAVTDVCNLFGLIKFYKNAIANGIKPIIGTEVSILACAV